MSPRILAASLCELGVIITAVFLPLSIAGAQIGAGVTAAGVLLGLGCGERKLLPAGILGPVLAFLAACCLASLVSPVSLPRDGWLAPRPVLLLLLVPAAFRLSTDPGRLARRTAVALLGAAVFVALLGVYQRSGGFDLNHALGLRRIPIRIPSPSGTGFSAIGTFNSRLTFAAVEAALLLVALSLLAGPVSRRVRAFSGLASLAVALAIAAAFARASWLGIGAGMALLVVGLRRRAAMLLLAVAASAALAGALVPSVRTRAASAMRATANQDRLFMWTRAAEVIADHPVLGVGVYGYPIVAGPYYDRHDPLFPMRTWTHNMSLTLLAETGIGGLLAWVWVFAAIFAVGWRAMRSAGGTGRALRLGALGGVVALLVVSLFHDILYDGEVALTVFFLAGLAVVPPSPPDASAVEPLSRN